MRGSSQLSSGSSQLSSARTLLCVSTLNTNFSCVLHTKKLKHATYKHMRYQNTCMHNTAYILHIYIYATFMHILGIIHHAYYTHISFIWHAHTQKLAQRHMHATQKHMKKCMQFMCNCLHAACMLYINNCMYAAHNNCTHVGYIYSGVFNLMCMYVACV